jgi:hypothetical protein
MPSMFNARDAGNYEKLMGRWSRRLAPLFIEHAGIADGEEILEIGCGTGSLTFALPQGQHSPGSPRSITRQFTSPPRKQETMIHASVSSRATAARSASPMPASTGRCRCWCFRRSCRNRA